jgi:peptide/nickel transport system substrate-binding protein
LTTEDVSFFYDHILANEVVTAAPLSGWKAGGELVKLEVIDDYTFKWVFAVPNPSFTLTLASERLYTGLRPKHYLAQFHGDLNPDADKLAEEAGQSTWAQLFALKIQPYDRTPWADADLDADQPTLETYVYKSTDAAGNKKFERNPYFFKVDVAGNQLPYTDGLNRILVQNLEVQDLKGISGEYTHYGWGTLSNFTTYKENEAAGDYSTRLLTYLRGNETGLAFNVNHPNPVKREVYGDLRFRKAMSLAINRQEINDLVYFGKATPRQASPTPIESYYSEELSNYYADFDVEEAGRLLDEMGLDKRDADGFRIGPDGETFIINMEQGAPEPAWVKTLELVTQHWNAIGVRTELKMIQVPLFQEKRAAGQLDVPAWAYDGGETSIWAGSITQFVMPPYGYGATQWDNWLTSDGANGEEPPQSVKDHVATYDAFRKVTPDSQEYRELGSELMRYAVENLYVIGTVGLPPQPLLIDNRLQNGPREGEYWSWSYRQWVKFHPEQFWLQDK